MPQLPPIGGEVTQVSGARKLELPPIGGEVTASADFKQSDTTPNEVDPNTIGTLLAHFAPQVNPIGAVQTIGKALLPEFAARLLNKADHVIFGSKPISDEAAATYGPINALTHIGAAQGALFDKAKASYEKGDYLTAARHFVDYLVPMAGPGIDKSGDLFQAGKWAAGTGEALGMGLAMFAPSAIMKAILPEAAPKFLAERPPVRAVTVADPVEKAAITTGQAEGVPIDAATASGNTAIRGVQALADKSLAGSYVATRASAATDTALTKWGERLSDQVAPASVTPEQAGQQVRDALAAKADGHAAEANTHYGTLGAFEQDPRYQRTVTRPAASAVDTGIVDANGEPVLRQAEPTLEKMGLPVDVRAGKKALQPVADQMRRQMPVTQQESSSGLKAIQNVLDGPDVAPLSQVDRDLGAIKTIARESGGIAKLAVTQLEKAVQQTAENAGPAVVKALRQARQATIDKFATEAVSDALPGGKMEEPMAVFNRVTAANDGGIELLRTVADHTPDVVPGLAKAKLEDVLALDSADKQFSAWSKLGDQTKAVLFPGDGQVTALDRFFLLSKRLAANPNPSGTGQAVMRLSEGGALFSNPLQFVLGEVGAAGLSALLHSPSGAKALSHAMLIAASPDAASAATTSAVAGQLMRAAEMAHVPLVIPQAARSTERPPR
jgi:hypothetical protein